MMISSIRPALAVGAALLAAVLILFFGNRIKANLREAITLTAAVIMTGLIFSMIPGVLDGNIYVSKMWTIVDGIDLTLKTDGAGMVLSLIHI